MWNLFLTLLVGLLQNAIQFSRKKYEGKRLISVCVTLKWPEEFADRGTPAAVQGLCLMGPPHRGFTLMDKN
jgi:hypothetical protein